jgi:hypothetical protein
MSFNGRKERRVMNVCSGSSPSGFHGKLVGGAVCDGPIPQLKNAGGFPAVRKNKRRAFIYDHSPEAKNAVSGKSRRRRSRHRA